MRQGAMLNTYPDSLGKNMGEMIEFLSMPEMKDVFQSLYLMPSVFNSDIDRGYSIITYDLAETVATEEDFAKLREMGFDMIFDFILKCGERLVEVFLGQVDFVLDVPETQVRQNSGG